MQDQQAQTTFDRILGSLHGISPSTKPTTVREILPFVGNVRSHIIQTYKSEDHGFVVFVEITDAEGQARIVLPNKVALAIYRQRQSLTDRSTPESRARRRRQRERSRRREERERRRQARVVS